MINKLTLDVFKQDKAVKLYSECPKSCKAEMAIWLVRVSEVVGVPRNMVGFQNVPWEWEEEKNTNTTTKFKGEKMHWLMT